MGVSETKSRDAGLSLYLTERISLNATNGRTASVFPSTWDGTLRRVPSGGTKDP